MQLSLPLTITLTLIMLLCGHAHTAISCDSLVCVTDYINNITCTWRPGTSLDPETTVTLSATSYGSDLRCELCCELCCEMRESEEPGLYTCTLYQDIGITSDIYNLTLQTQGLGKQPTPQNCTEFDPTQNIKPPAPFNLSVWASSNNSSSSLSWAMLYDEYSYLTDFLYELHISSGEEGERHIESVRTVVSLSHSLLVPGTEYEARVRAHVQELGYSGQWSEWSPSVRWRTADKAVLWTLWLPLLFGVLIVLLIVIFFRFRVFQRVWNKLWILPPNPAPFFKPLFRDHGGNFTSWVNARYPHTMYEVSEKSLMVMEKGDAVQVFDAQAKDKRAELHSSWQALGGPMPWGVSYSGGRFGAETPHWGERSYGQVSIDTVTVADEPAPCCVQCQCHCSSQRAPRPSLLYGSGQANGQEPELTASLLVTGHSRQLLSGRVWAVEDQGPLVAGTEGEMGAWDSSRGDRDTGSWSDRSLDSLSYRSQLKPNPDNLSDPGYPRHPGNLSDPGYPRHPGNLSDPGYPRHPGNLSDPGYPRHPGNLSDPGYPRHPGNLSDPGYPHHPGNLSDPGYPRHPGNLSNPGYPRHPGNLSDPGYPRHPGNLSDPGYPRHPGNLSDPGYPRHPGNLSDPGYPRHPGNLSDLGYPCQPSNLSDPGYPRYPGNLSDPGYPCHPGNLSDPGYPRDLGDLSDPDYPRDLGDLSDPGSPHDLGDPGYPKLLDLDTVDSGFMEIDSDSTSEAEGSGEGGTEGPGEEGQYCRSYMKQWVTSNSGITGTRSPR
ncbi:interleukin-21 receptor [Callorhinchus milii]|uniref:interleukin-21 receptor n=1 Tax=Callorhinchus milii TaxID=7868 RepID=UPI001C3F62AF|nr:interleukin-21 receptor [Callorhinchus milii]